MDGNGVISITKACAVAGLGGKVYRSGDYDYYINETVSFPVGGDEQNRTVDPLLARQVLSQLSYTPRYSPRSASHPRPFPFSEELVGSSGLEPTTSRLSGARSNHLSYEPIHECSCLPRFEYALAHSKLNNTYLKQLP